MFRNSFRRAATIAVFAAAVFATIMAGKAFVSESAGIVVVWPAAGLVFAALVQTRGDRWGEILAAAFAANALGNGLLGLPAGLNLCLCAANALESLLVAGLVLQLVQSRLALDRVHQVVVFLFSALVGTAASALIAAVALHAHDRAAVGEAWTAWLIADFLGILLVGGLICAWSNMRPARPLAASEVLLRVGLASLLLVSAAWVFAAVDANQVWGIRRAWILLVLVQFLALRCPPHQTLTAVFVSSSIAVAFTVLDRGPFALYSTKQSDQLLDLQAFLCGVVAVNLLFCAAACERRRSVARRERRLAVVERQRERAALDAAALERQAVALESAKQLAEGACKAKSMFLANMSHEIRTPLTSILGFADLLKEEPLSREGMAAAETIYRNGDHLLALLNDLLDLSKIESGKLEFVHQPFDPRTILQEVESLVRVRAKEKGLSLETSVGSAVPPVIWSDPLRLRQAFLNLASNAVKFTSSGTVTLALEQAFGPGERRLCFRVMDTGIGLHPDQFEKIFEPFVQADASTTRTHGGSGLGLAITKRIAESLQGRVTVESCPGRGSTFRFYFAANDIRQGSSARGKTRHSSESGAGLQAAAASVASAARLGTLGLLDGPSAFARLRETCGEAGTERAADALKTCEHERSSCGGLSLMDAEALPPSERSR